MASSAGPSTAGPAVPSAHAALSPDAQERNAMPSSSERAPDREEADTCRICRGESTEQEPLFYPCKCSGSIKYVHQECLMEWLSHSQKKYCELCKTSFRFTKLYHPAMPSRIPTAVFVRRAAVHILKLFMTWCRAILVSSVWMILLPWCMRIVWRSLFWIGDGGWTRPDLDVGGNKTQTTAPSPFDLDAVYSAKKASMAANASMPLPIPTLVGPVSQTLNMTNNSTFWSLLERLALFRKPQPTISVTNSTDYLGPRSPSLLSEFTFFNLFPSQAANRFVIDVLEGQLITLFVVVAFILIFLIREWVVQQQPVINLGALGDDANVHHDHDQGEEDEIENDIDDLEEEEEEEQGSVNEVRDQQVLGEDDLEDAPARRELVVVNPDEAPANPIRRDSSSGTRHVQTVARTPNNGEDLPEESMDALPSGTSAEVAQLIQQMPHEDSVRVGEALAKISRMQTSSGEFKDGTGNNASHEQDEPESSDARGRRFPPRTSSLMLEENTKRDAASPSPSRRPPLPPRDRSSIATQIRRGLEEGSSWSFENLPQSSEDHINSTAKEVPESWDDQDIEPDTAASRIDRAVAEHAPGSDDSSESWQHISEAQSDHTGRRPSQDRGKARATPDVPEESCDARSTFDDESGSSDIQVANNAQTPFNSAHSPRQDEEHEADSDDEQAEPQPASEPTEDQVQAPAHDAAHALPPPRLADRIMDWIFGDVAPDVQAAEDAANDEHIVQNLADEAPFVPANDAREPVAFNDQDAEVAAAAAEAGIDVNDQDAIDDAEDLEGIMELIGMQGPLTGLFQNAMFSAVLISATLTCAVWLPYLWGKLVILVMGSPVFVLVKLPLQVISILADFAVDGALCLAAGSVYWMLKGTLMLIKLCSFGLLNRLVQRPVNFIAVPAYSIAASAAGRLRHLFLESSLVPTPSYLGLSVNSHVALRSMQNTTSHALNQTGALVASLYEDTATESTIHVVSQLLRKTPSAIYSSSMAIYGATTGFASWIFTAKSYKIKLDLDMGANMNAAYTALEQWTAVDRLIAVLAGYACFAFFGAMYLRRGTPLSSSQQGQKVERIIAEVLQQAGGVLKVILIISIEMLVFPLYCGLLLDMALLPLFKDASLYTRWQFTRESPWTSGFVHWFLGTCYMFHFALFVSMCRKILRRGVLYFIRDPDDPTFHPVRDVLERSVTTQLRKIAFSGLVYGGLVIVCLGGVVYCLNTVTVGVLPIHWVSHAPSLEFPLDLLFYNFLTPVIIKVYKPSDALHTVSEWWFKNCARGLRLSNFLFGGDHPQEERRRIINGVLVTEGKYVRAPASDQVRIPKGEPVFIEVDSENRRKDGKLEEGGVHNSDLVTKVYIPPWFRLRIAAFVVTIWIFAAIMGVSATITPLVVGRYLFSLFLPSRIEMNDIHAFSLGVYTLGSVAYTSFQAYKFLRGLNGTMASPLAAVYNVAATASRISVRALRFAYVWTGLILVIPFLSAVLIELYFLMPLHAYLGPAEPHVVHLVQDWTLGFLYARLIARIIFSDRNSRPARAFSAIVQNGYLHPNARVATRCFLLPTMAVFTTAVVIPSLFAISVNKTLYLGADATTKSQVWRFSYPAVGLSLAAFCAAREALNVVRRWRMVVRDEVYLIGERLHNFGDRRTPAAPIWSALPEQQDGGQAL